MSPADVRLSKYLSLLLRHKPEAAGLHLDGEGWADLGQVVAAARQRRLASRREDVERVVATNDKRRFAISDDGRRIRAVQGHSTPVVARELASVTPPQLLFHGTAEHNLGSILAEGLSPGRRHHVHLSPDEPTAVAVGRRHGKPIVLRIAAGAMHRDGCRFFRAENGVWLTKSVPPQYIETPGRPPR